MLNTTMLTIVDCHYAEWFFLLGVIILSAALTTDININVILVSIIMLSVISN